MVLNNIGFVGESPSAMLTTTIGTHQVEEMLIQVAEGMSS